MSMERFQEYLELIQSSGMKELRLLGGEPTIHPQFPEFVEIGLRNGLYISVFSNGVMPERALEVLSSLHEEKCSVIINMNAAISPEQKKIKLLTLERLGQRAIPGFTITSPDFSLGPLIESIKTYGMRRQIRLGLSHPIADAVNQALHPKQYAKVGAAILAQSALTAAEQISLDTDCGFVRCMFPPGCEEELNRNLFLYRSSCNPILDLCSDGSVLSCFALSGQVKMQFDPKLNLSDMRKKLDAELSVWRICGVYPECSECSYFHSAECCGGCLSAVMRRFHPVMKGSVVCL